MYSAISIPKSHHGKGYQPSARRRSQLPRRVIIAATALCSAFVIATLFSYHRSDLIFIHRHAAHGFAPLDGGEHYDANGDLLPPLYERAREETRALPQHDEGASWPDGAGARYVRFANEMSDLGLNNQLQERLLNSHLAFLSGRGYVFSDFLWDSSSSAPYMPVSAEHMNHLARVSFRKKNSRSPSENIGGEDDDSFVPLNFRSTRTPLRAVIHAPASGSSLVESASPYSLDPTRGPRAISVDHYEQICPPGSPDRLEVDGGEVSRSIGVNVSSDEGSRILERWTRYLQDRPERCVHVSFNTERVFDFEFLNTARMLSVWPSFSTSPTARLFDWSPVINYSVKRNLRHLGLETPRLRWFTDSSQLAARGEDIVETKMVPGLLTVHLRRKDFKPYCTWMSDWAVFEGWNSLPFLPDRFQPPANSASVSTKELSFSAESSKDSQRRESARETRKSYMISRCFIDSKETVVSRLREVRKESRSKRGIRLTKIYLATNEDEEWVSQLKRELVQDGWRDVRWTGDRQITWEESGVDGPIDMEMASRGEVFLGNGFSSFTSTVVNLRLMRGTSAKSIRYW